MKVKKEEKYSGIYCIENLIDGKKYIGQASVLINRKYYHFSELRRNNHGNIHLQRAYNKYGAANFIFKILLICEKDKKILTYYEQSLNDFYKKQDLSYNIRECVDSNLGIVRSEEFKQNMSKRNAGKNNPNFGKTPSDETRLKMSESHIGKTLPEEQKKKISEALSGENNPNYGKKMSEESKKKMIDNMPDFSGENGPFFGKHHSEESKIKISEKAKNPSEETRKKMSDAKKGRKLSEETKHKISESEKGRVISQDSINKMIETKRKNKENNNAKKKSI
jgi:hypothetical protein